MIKSSTRGQRFADRGGVPSNACQLLEFIDINSTCIFYLTEKKIQTTYVGIDFYVPL